MTKQETIFHCLCELIGPPCSCGFRVRSMFTDAADFHWLGGSETVVTLKAGVIRTRRRKRHLLQKDERSIEEIAEWYNSLKLVEHMTGKQDK